MGVIIHDVVIVQIDADATGWAEPLRSFYLDLPLELRACLVGPVVNPMYGGQTVIWTPDGGKEGHPMSNLANEWRARFINLFAGQSDDVEILYVRFGGDMEDVAQARMINSPCHPDDF